MRLYFTRHGESEANTRRIISNRDLPHPLTENGRQQAAGLAYKLREKNLNRIYTSPIPRARETAEILSAQLKIPLEFSEALREPDCGILEGRGDEAAWAEHNYWKEAWLKGRALEHGPQGGETCVQVRERLAIFIGNLIAEHGKTRAEFLLVTHGALILFGLPGLITGLNEQTLLDQSLDHTALISAELKNGRLVYLGASSRETRQEVE